MDIVKRLERRRKINSKTECWEWTGAKRGGGYGLIIFRINGKVCHRSVHRIAYENYVGKIPEGMCVCHTCDNPPCFNPKHLWIGTSVENTYDRHRKGRDAKGDNSGLRLHPEARSIGLRNGKYTKPESTLRGEDNGRAKLTEKDVIEIRKKYIPKIYTMRMLAKEYGLWQGSIFRIIRGIHWKHIAST